MKKKNAREMIRELEKWPAKFTEADRFMIERAYRMAETVYMTVMLLLAFAAIALFLGICTGRI